MIDEESLEPRLRLYLNERADERPPIGLEDRILRGAQDQPRRSAPASVPAQVLAAAGIAVLAIGLAAGVAYFRGHGTAGKGTRVALSLGTGGGADWVVVRGIDVGPSALPSTPRNALMHTADDGASWQTRLTFAGGYDGMSWSSDGRDGVVWTNDMTRPCGQATTCYQPSNEVVTVYSTTDSGLHWTQHSPKTLGNVAAVYFRGLEGWALSEGELAQPQTNAGGATLYRSTDGGAQWSKVAFVPGVTGMAMLGGFWGKFSGVGENILEFADSQHGWLATGAIATATNSGLLATTDGGRTWHSVAVQAPTAMAGQDLIVGYPIIIASGQALLPAFFGHQTDPNNFTVSHHYIYSSSNDGKTWDNPRPLEASGLQPTGDEWQNFYLDADHWWFTAVNERSAGEPVPQAGPAVARTTDGGKTWQVFTDKSAPTILQLTFTDAEHGWARAITGPDNTNILLRTTDGGAHWRQVQLP
jgi:photosystem II stability/assembly factor-like uncharacterized protein